MCCCFSFRCWFDHELLLSCVFFGISNYFVSIFKTIWTCFADPRITTNVDDRKFSVCKDVSQQKISYDCGIHAIVNAFLIINRLPFLSDMPSQKTRNYVRHILYTSNVEDVKFEALEKQQWEALSISFSFWESENCQVKFDLQHLAHCVSDFTVDNKSKWSMCDVTTCTGDKRDEEQILCVTCRRSFHKNCLQGSGESRIIF